MPAWAMTRGILRLLPRPHYGAMRERDWKAVGGLCRAQLFDAQRASSNGNSDLKLDGQVIEQLARRVEKGGCRRDAMPAQGPATSSSLGEIRWDPIDKKIRRRPLLLGRVKLSRSLLSSGCQFG